VERIPKSGLYYPNKIGRIYLMAMEEIMGKNGLNAILNSAGMQQFIDNYPPDNLSKEFDFADWSTLNAALEDMYGERGGRGLRQRAGRASFNQGLKTFGALAGASDLAFRVLPLSIKLKVGVPSMAKVFSSVSDQKSEVTETETEYLYTMKPCPCCWGRKSTKPVCFDGIGVLQAGLEWVSGGRSFKVYESKCTAMGDDVCLLNIVKEPIG
jgi:predicted hydrocarbon binding protein